MNIYAKKGDKVIFNHPTAGYAGDQLDAKKYLKIGKVYKVEKTEVGSWSTRVHLQKIKGVCFNSVMFDDYKNPAIIKRERDEDAQSAIYVLKIMIKHYEERGGGYSQKEALKLAIQSLLIKPEIDEEKLGKVLFLKQAIEPIQWEEVKGWVKEYWNKKAHAIATSDIWKEER